MGKNKGKKFKSYKTTKLQNINHYAKNMAVFKEKYPEYAEKVDNAVIDPKVVQEKSGIHVPTIKYDGRYLYEKKNPLQTCANNIMAHDVNNHCRLAVFCGFAAGYDTIFYTEQISQKYNTAYIIIIEHDPGMVKLAMQLVDMTQFLSLGRVSFIIEENNQVIFDKITKILVEEQKFYFLRSLQYFYNMEYFNIHKDRYMQVIETFRNAAQYTVMYYDNDPLDSLVGVENMFNNVSEIVNNPGINMLEGKFKGVPAICVASGPSLDKNIDQLKDLQDKAIIIAADASLLPLLRAGIKPHIVTSLEREMEVVKLFSNIPDEYDYSGVYLAACPVVYNQVYEAYKGKRLIVYRMFDHFKWLGIEKGLLEIKVSPGNMNFKIAEYLGCETIILVGQDLAIYGDKTNVTGTPHGEGYHKTYTSEPQMQVKGNYEKLVTTTRSLKMMLDAFNSDCINYKGLCINATEGGAYISNTMVDTLEETKEKYLNKTFDIKEMLDKHLSLFDVNTPLELAKVSARIVTTMESLKKSRDICYEAYEWLMPEYNYILGNDDEAEVDKVFEEILKWKGKIHHDKETWQLYFSHIAQSMFIAHEMKCDSLFRSEKDRITAKIKVLDEHIEFFKMTGNLLEVCIVGLNKAFNDIDMEVNNV